MNRRPLLIAASITMFLSLVSQQALASHRTPLQDAACEYRDAATHFAREMVTNRDLSRAEKRLAHPLVQAAGRMHVITQHPHLYQHLGSTWHEIERIHCQIEAIVFNHPGCPVYRSLRPCWEEVLCAYRELAAELHRLDCHDDRPLRNFTCVDGADSFPWTDSHRHLEQSKPTLPPVDQPSYRYRGGETASYRYREAVVPSYRYGNFSHNVLPPSSDDTAGLSPSEHQTDATEREAARRRLESSGRGGATGADLTRWLK